MAVRVVYGADEDEFDSIVGVEFSQAIPAVKEIMGVPDTVDDIRLNGKQDPMPTTILKEGDVITFYKRAGKKGM